MKGALFMDSDGKEKPYYMGCYGIGIGRTLATIVETYHDDKGIIWPENIAPYKVHLIALGKESTIYDKATQLEKELTDHGIDVLYDDRQEVSAGAKFADADLIGIPYRLVISPKTEGKIEIKKRTERDTRLLSKDELMKLLIP